jgi:hypothetical protein
VASFDRGISSFFTKPMASSQRTALERLVTRWNGEDADVMGLYPE